MNQVKNYESTEKHFHRCGNILTEVEIISTVDLLKYGSDTNTTHYVDTMFSLGLYPLIDKPTRMTAYSATLIER